MVPYKDPKKQRQAQREYTKRFPARRQLSNKLAWLKINYGEAARLYFVEHSRCERCPEDRLSALSVHHRQGKHVEDFETLCHNCHAIHHHGAWTFKQGIQGRTKPIMPLSSSQV